jgi:lysozyme family protein
MKKGCQSPKIEDVQKCLGLKADGKLGPGTEKALKQKGYSVPLTQADYDKIMAECNKSTTTTTTEPPIVGPDFRPSQEI